MLGMFAVTESVVVPDCPVAATGSFIGRRDGSAGSGSGDVRSDLMGKLESSADVTRGGACSPSGL